MTLTDSYALPDAVPSRGEDDDMVVRAMYRIESSAALERLSRALEFASRPLAGEPTRSLLLGAGTGHALHPFMTDVPIGLWSSAVLLDVRGRRADRPAARLLLAAGLVSVLPTVATGLAEWRQLNRPENRVGALHAALNLGAVALYAVSLGLRRRGQHGSGIAASMAATVVASGAGYLGGHLAIARKAGTRHPAYETDAVGPSLGRPDPR
ncbi:(2Fe-2S)-binding protein [Pedococcus bigeumensis]|uniref:(2Fe-2S)-binding protein n=2 Tax=Pedococcus bigeumensis TaxID=433644 RepID=A0A502CMR1_9MICO|nr:(2Fe-2S)-binding protein [Pedococcus bigeumensis]